MIFIAGVSVYLTARSGLFQIRGFFYILRNTLGRLRFGKRSEAVKGQMTPFQATTTALASTVGTGNIAGRRDRSFHRRSRGHLLDVAFRHLGNDVEDGRDHARGALPRRGAGRPDPRRPDVLHSKRSGLGCAREDFQRRHSRELHGGGDTSIAYRGTRVSLNLLDQSLHRHRAHGIGHRHRRDRRHPAHRPVLGSARAADVRGVHPQWPRRVLSTTSTRFRPCSRLIFHHAFAPTPALGGFAGAAR